MATKTINVISTSVIRTGTSAKGAAWTLYEVVATDVEGQPIELTLKSFDHLSGTVEVEVEKQEHEKYGTSYMLKAAGGSRGGGGGGGNGGLGKSVEELRGRVDALEGRVAALEQSAKPATSVAAPADDDIPF